MNGTVGVVVLWPGRGVYRVVLYAKRNGQMCACIRGLEGQGAELDVPVWKLRPIVKPLDEYPPLPAEKK